MTQERINEREEQGLSTADLAATAEQQRSVQGGEPEPVAEERVPAEADAASPVPTSGPPMAEASATPLLSSDDVQGFRSRWDTIQTGFVDEPRRSVEQADQLVAEAIKRLAEGFAAERDKLEAQWDRGDDISTEDLRVALQRYRAFFDRLLSL